MYFLVEWAILSQIMVQVYCIVEDRIRKGLFHYFMPSGSLKYNTTIEASNFITSFRLRLNEKYS